MDDDHSELTVEITIPGVRKGDTYLRIHEDSLALRAHRDNFEYATILVFCCPVISEQTKAVYDNGLLTLVAALGGSYGRRR